MAMLGTPVRRWMASAVSGLVVVMAPGGAVLAAPPSEVSAATQQAAPVAADNLDARINAAIEARTKDSKLVEFEVAEAVAERMFKWASWFGLAVGVPLAILAAVLTLLGVRSYRDVQHRIAAARADVDSRRAQADALQKDYDELRARYASLLELEANVRALAGRVDHVEEVVGFQKSKALTPKLQASLEETLRRYRAWLADLGFDPKDHVSVLIDRLSDPNAYYEAGKIVIDPRIARDPDVVLREFSHHALRSARGESDHRAFTAIQSGLSDYLPCSFNGNPLFAVKAAPVFARRSGGQVGADGYTRRMTNAARIDGEVTEHTVHSVGEGWGGAVWELRGLIGDHATDAVVLRAWKAADVIADTPQGELDFARRVAALAVQVRPAAKAAIAEVFARRGLDIGKPARRRASATA